ncbi:hypothetical protein [Syntrophorhabdus aromaticivorans]|uniref:Vitamin K epoxide reductase domain-containing protein n=1 Tax=Syntrophorhabdus aromaticivorans TaxID=328301 RepID=A0A971M2P9_9BACT|nr:hypothetical protein [Syntrophorhabdus aromaticivorans]NLW34750.1 hypothetical protein [Syntrophorhabdus aromaticivorans]
MSILPLTRTIAGHHPIARILNIILPLIGIALMLVYEYCNASCSYLKGSFLGLDLKWVGIIYMAILFFNAVFGGENPALLVRHLRTIMISAAVGVEFFLIGFQVVHNIYCPFCLAFSACIFVLFGINFASMNRWIVVASVVAGFLGIVFFFEGQVVPVFDL